MLSYPRRPVDIIVRSQGFKTSQSQERDLIQSRYTQIQKSIKMASRTTQHYPRISYCTQKYNFLFQFQVTHVFDTLHLIKPYDKF
jgi:hypothetical protein